MFTFNNWYSCKEIYNTLYTSPSDYSTIRVFIDGMQHTPLELIDLDIMKVRYYREDKIDNYTDYMFTLLKGGE